MSSIISILSDVGMAAGPPLIYVDQAISIIKSRDSSGFSHDVCGVILIANITRCFFYLGHHFEFPLLIQSILLILSQLILLAICLHYQAPPATHAPPSEGLFAKRPLGFWQWRSYGVYLEFLAGMIVVLGIAQLIFGRWSWYVESLGYIALGIESTLPIPQFISNFRRKSTYGFRDSTLAGWFGGDAFKTVYFFVKGNPLQFKVTACLTLAWDTAVLIQRIKYGAAPPYKHQMDYEHEDLGVVGGEERRSEEEGGREGDALNR